jgi:uncharacterized membrane protein
MRRITTILLELYAVLSLYVLLRAILELPFQIIPAIMLSLLAFSFTVLHAGLNLGWHQAILFLLLTLSISLLFETTGVATGWFFGEYHYTAEFGPRFFGLVPYLIPINWFMMLYPSYIITIRILPAQTDGWKKLVFISAIGGMIMTAWDLAMDPLMVARGHWVWETEGAYFGIPLQNYLGWWSTSFIILCLYGWISQRWQQQGIISDHAFNRLAVSCYAITGLGSVFGALIAGLNGAALAGFFAMFPWVVLGWIR